MITLNPLVTTAYTDKGNKYQKANAGKLLATGIVAGSVGYASVKYGKNIAKKAAKINKQTFVNLLNNVKTYAKKGATKLTSSAKSMLGKGTEAVKNAAGKISFNGPKEAIKEIVKKPIAKKAAIVAGAAIALVALDYVFNKYSAHKADKK